MQLKVLLILFTSVTVADEHTHKLLSQVRQATNEFHDEMAGWEGNYLGAVPVLKRAHNLKRTLDKALAPAAIEEAMIAPRSDHLESETMEMARNMANEIGQTVDTAIGMMPLLEGIPYAGRRVGAMIFRSLHEASNSLGEEFAPRASEENQEEARAIVREIDEHLLRGLAAFQ
jgi:hypothetical protein